jgi:diguanylate cyclase (GGDEF)-like protein
MDRKPTTRLRILLVDDDEEERLLTQDFLADRSYLTTRSEPVGFSLDWVATYEDALEAFARAEHDIYLVDYYLGKRDGLQLLREVIEKGCNKPIILMTGRGNYELDIEAMNAGATDYLVKGELNAPLLERTIRYALERKRAEEEIRQSAARAQALAALSRAFAETRLNYPAVLNTITRHVFQTLGDGCVLRMTSENGQYLIPAAYSPQPPDGHLAGREKSGEPAYRTNEGLCGQVFQSGRPLLLPVVPHAQALDPFEAGTLAASMEAPVQSLLIVPLSVQGRLTGTLSALRFKPGQPYTQEDLVFFQEIASRAAMAIENALLHAEVQRLAITDALTEVYNRRGLTELGRREVERSRRFGRPLCAIMVDLDHFKTINDSYGHAAGDRVLRVTAERLRASVRDVDILARFGGDEFMVLLPETDVTIARAISERIRQRVALPISLFDAVGEKRSVQLTASLGVSDLKPETGDLAGLFNRADAATYAAKHLGRDCVQIG